MYLFEGFIQVGITALANLMTSSTETDQIHFDLEQVHLYTNLETT